MATTSNTFELPVTITGLWSLCSLAPIRSRDTYEEAAAVFGKLAVRKLNAVQREYPRELIALVEAYEDEHGETERALACEIRSHYPSIKPQ